MNISLHIEAASPIELQEAITGLAGITGGAAASQPETDKPKRATKNSEKLVNKPGVTPEITPDPEPADEPTTAESEAADEYIPTVVELRAKAQEKGTSPEGKKSIKSLLDEFGSKSISDVPEDKRSSFMSKLEAL
ncbi:hypothetical protein [Dehalobacter sp. TeCB1]|uniref:hypothetical protein n=1 Tax=Dehalobacter sp. TeCB1 TaxID=1843715 RepID=UPI00083ABCC7|nr:hypothetical protein [Dehalobacter sp. TeCB1]OCZ54338.1 hypothetical protein A7D23_06110 [Dehalobacter sp. TeCB1]